MVVTKNIKEIPCSSCKEPIYYYDGYTNMDTEWDIEHHFIHGGMCPRLPRDKNGCY